MAASDQQMASLMKEHARVLSEMEEREEDILQRVKVSFLTIQNIIS